MRILTKSDGSVASEIAAVEPEMPTQRPQSRLQRPTVRPPQKMEKAAVSLPLESHSCGASVRH